MSITRYIKRMQYIDYMIKKRSTGDLASFARKNRASKSTLSAILSEMKEMGFPIRYDRHRRTYYYSEAGEMIGCLFLRYGEVLSRENIKKLEVADSKLCFSSNSIFELCYED